MAPDRRPAGLPLVSVIVPTRNSERTLARCLYSIRAQTWRPLELIVVDNGSHDGTVNIAARYADLVLKGGPERSAQRNLGIVHSRGTYVLWIDSDMDLEPAVIERSMDAARRQDAVGVFISERSVGTGFWTACRRLERRCYAGEPRIESPRLVRRDYLERINGFREDLSGTEDAALRNRMLADRAALATADAWIDHDEGRITLVGAMRKRLYYGRGLATYQRLHPGAAAHQAGATLRAYARRWRLLASHPVLTAGIVVMRVAELMAYGAGAVAGRWERH